MESHECEEKTPIHYSRPDYTGNVLVNRSKGDIVQLSNILNNDKVIELASAVEKMNPVQTSPSSTVDLEVFEI
jgi:hypothetical protein